MIEESQTEREERTGPDEVEGGTKEGARARRGKKKYLGKKNRKFPWLHLKPQRLRVCVIFHNQSGLANLGLPHLLKGCFGMFLELLRHFRSLPASSSLAFLALGRKFLPQVFPFCTLVRCALASQISQLHPPAAAVHFQCVPSSRLLSLAPSPPGYPASCLLIPRPF